MPHVLAAGKLHDSGLRVLEEAAGISFDHVEEISLESMLPKLDQAEGLILRTQPLAAESVALAPHLKIVSRHGVGYDAVDVQALNARGIPLTIVGDANSIAVAEHAMMQMLAAIKRLVRNDRATRGGDWGYRNRLEAQELHGKRLLILGFGRIGRRLAPMAAAFGMSVHAYDPFVTALDDLPVTLESDLTAALTAADVISVHTPKTDAPLIGAAELAAMKPSAVLVNAARGGVVDEPALIAALSEGRLGAAALDVFDSEPPATDDPLLALDQIVLTPHIAGLTAESAERMAIASAQNVVDFFAGRIDPALVVNAEHCDLAAGGRG